MLNATNLKGVITVQNHLQGNPGRKRCCPMAGLYVYVRGCDGILNNYPSLAPQRTRCNLLPDLLLESRPGGGSQRHSDHSIPPPTTPYHVQPLLLRHGLQNTSCRLLERKAPARSAGYDSDSVAGSL